MEQALRCIHRQVREATQRDRLLSGIAATVKTANHIFIRYTPRVVKEFMIRRVYRVIAGTGMTTTLSNLGFQKPAPWWKRSSTVLRCILVRAEAG